MNILLLGKNGQVGWELQHTLEPLGLVHATDYPAIDFRDVSAIRTLVRLVKPNVIFNAAAYTDVDQAEKNHSEAFAINSTAPGILAEEAKQIGAGLFHYSTDYVFDGEKDLPYIEDDTPNPINNYGMSKLEGERAIQKVDGAYLILRTSCLYSSRRDCFVTKVLRWSREQRTLRVVSDLVGSPTWARVLAEIAAQLLQGMLGSPADWFDQHKGIYHVAGRGSSSRFEWAKAVLRNDPRQDEQVCEAVLPAKLSDFPMPAQRPKFTALNCERFCNEFGLTIPPWEQTLQLAMENSAPPK